MTNDKQKVVSEILCEFYDAVNRLTIEDIDEESRAKLIDEKIDRYALILVEVCRG